ncbi:toprim domain-containing protein [Mycobacterium sp.]|uniref:toprim domain-containing protein n=1 Tax=Mycobacterium sp. TaxID=1785 RepID=UPI0025E4D6FC|nr:toprim domain-containing protein [Mycobacterium sp.]
MSTRAIDRCRDAFLAAGLNWKDTAGDKASAQAPGHSSADLSVSFKQIDGQVLVHCHAGEDKGTVLEAVGLQMRDLYDEARTTNSTGALRDSTTFEYPDRRFVHRSLDSKTFRQTGNTTGTALFHVDRIADAETVYVVEGEKDVLAMESEGAAAVCSAMGAGKAHLANWTPLRDKSVIIVADKDIPGYRHAAQVAEQLDGLAASIRTVEAATGKDAADHIAAGHSLDEFTPAADITEAAADKDDPAGVTWRPVDLGPYLRGEITPPKPALGVARDDGQRCLYPGREHAVIGETESGKTWFCLLCAAAEIRTGNRVVYIHFEEGDPGSTVERLKFLGLSDDAVNDHLAFIGPAEQVRREWLTALMEPAPTLVVLDGVNEAMALHGAEIKAAEGASEFRRRLVTPFLRAGAAVLSCDHLPMGTDHTRRDAYGTVHKGNAIDGARFVLVNKEPFGRGMRGMSHVYLTKDRPGALRIHGRQTGVPGKSYFGALSIDATGNSPELWGFYPPRDTDQGGGIEGGDPAAEAIIGAIEKAGGAATSFNNLCALLRDSGMGYKRTRIRDAVDDLVVAARLLEAPGARGAIGYRLPDSTGSVTGSGSGSDEAAA